MLVAIDIQPFEGTKIPQPSRETAELVRACALSSSDSVWCEFIERFRRPIGLAIVRVARSWGVPPQEFVDDLVQETFLKLCADKCAHLYEFSKIHPEAVEGYVKTIAANVARDYFKANASIKRGGGETAQLPETVEAKADLSSLGGVHAIEREVLLREIDNCLEAGVEGTSKSRDRLIFWLHYKQGMSASAIAAIPAIGLTDKGVESVVHRLTKLVRSMLTTQCKTYADSTRAKGFGSVESY